MWITKYGDYVDFNIKPLSSNHAKAHQNQIDKTILKNKSLAGGNTDQQLVEMSDTNLRKQEQITRQTERELLELEEREQDIRQLEVRPGTYRLQFPYS